jgi:uncharacterized protein (DUF924 family)
MLKNVFGILVCSFAFISNTAAEQPQVKEILEYWFGNLNSAEDYPTVKAPIWFGGGEAIDNDIRTRFGELVISATKNELDTWKETPRGRLALIILVDQFTRNIFRGTPQAFEYDHIAQELTMEGLVKGDDQALYPVERAFFYLPLEHAENMELQEISVERFHSILADAPAEHIARFKSFEAYAWSHYDIIAKFGRFPHRNKILSRESTVEEIEFLKGPNSSF